MKELVPKISGPSSGLSWQWSLMAVVSHGSGLSGQGLLLLNPEGVCTI